MLVDQIRLSGSRVLYLIQATYLALVSLTHQGIGVSGCGSFAFQSRVDQRPWGARWFPPFHLDKKQDSRSYLTGVIEVKILLANYFFMSKMPILLLSNLRNSISFSRGTTKTQGFRDIKQCFVNSIFVLIAPSK